MSELVGLPRRQFANLTRAGRLLAARAQLPRSGRRWLEVKFSGGMPELGGGVSFGSGADAPLGYLELLTLLKAVETDASIEGVLLRFDDELGGWSRAYSLQRAVWQLRESGVRVVAWGSSFSAEQYLVASACEKVWLPVSASLGLVGLRSEQFYLRDMLEKWEVVPEVVRIGKFKNAGEPFSRNSMSDEQREQIEGWLGDVFSALVDGIAQGRGLAPSEVRDRIDGGPYTAAAALEAGLVDGCLYADQIEDTLLQWLQQEPSSTSRAESGGAEAEGSAEAELHFIKAQSYSALFGGDVGWQPLWSELPGVAYVAAIGSIRRGAGRRGICSERLGPLLAELRERDSVCGVLLRIDSPGGDAVASDLLYRQVQRLAERKPVVVSMGEVAASGGYYIAAAAHRVLAEAVSLTGSIGVVGGKLNLAGLYRRLGIAKDGVELGARAGLESEARGFTPDERRAVEAGMEAVYALFVERVAQGRGLTLDAVAEVAEGRIWSGRRAAELGLVDGLGGPLEALAELRKLAGLADHERHTTSLHPRRSPLRGVSDLLHSLVEAV